MLIPIEDGFEDVLGKAMSGLGLTAAALAEAAGLELAQVEALLHGQLDEQGPDALGVLAPILDLSASALLALAQQTWQPELEVPEACALFNTPFPVPGYQEMTVNSYLFWSGGEAVAVDTGANAAPLMAEVSKRGLSLRSLLITHTHRDHIAALAEIRAAYPELTVYCPEKETLPDTVSLREGSRLCVGDWQVQARETSGHSPGALSYLIQRGERRLAFVGDAIFCLSMGKAPGAYSQALHNNREKLLSLPPETILCPGHGPLTTVANELARNPFFS
jgi:glyoxylase-like metal-dependent hydrolase (beta-lactamase superfamily II)